MKIKAHGPTHRISASAKNTLHLSSISPQYVGPSKKPKLETSSSFDTEDFPIIDEHVLVLKILTRLKVCA
ncbi:uncharacterized protein SETTUDRAFT_173420 [Exserohilum turcica Et28A]|uniref:Uncharacterized protein n=1 Tax=Exserohilum turcicum (strain 28A) TaxID=671987 RepID=R0K2Z8_EXST2|nr:uncharacterized protein SETTUDRAFT_173420 [Exserohilum turcica Et28A]EOA82757.1 hypothetical protein SETTUDRAFT_173420 [Exserohilum turcica Et28A]